MKPNHHIPPKRAEQFLQWFIRGELAEEVLGDLEEKFYSLLDQKSPFQAKLNYWYQVFNYLRPFAIRSNPFQFSNYYPMYRHNFLISWRTLNKNKTYSSINIGGLALGMAVAILLGLWIRDELTFNTYHQNYDDIAQVMQNTTFNGEIETWMDQPKQLGPELKNTYGTNFKHVSMASWIFEHVLSVEDKNYKRNGIFMESGAPEMLSLNMLAGTREGLRDPYSILISSSTANAIFKHEDPIGKIIKLDNNNDLTVSGVYEDLPFNSTFSEAAFFASWELYEMGLPDRLTWGNSWFQTFVQIADKTHMSQVSEAIKDAKLKRIDESQAKYKPQLFLHPMSKWHLYSEFEQGVSIGGRIKFVWLFGMIGLFVLILACINFMNLSTARSEKRSREVGVRKAIGSTRSQLMGQFFSESVLIAFFAALLAIVLVQLFLPTFNQIADKEIEIFWSNPWFWGAVAGFTLVTGLLAGIYPALYLSSFQTVKVLKGSLNASRYAAMPRKVLVVFQFTVSVSLIICTLIVSRQIQHAKNRPVGYDRERLISVPLHDNSFRQSFDAFRHDLLQTGMIEEVARSTNDITRTYTTNSGLRWKGKDPDMQDEFVTLGVSFEFGKTIDWHLKEGRNFNPAFATDTFGFIINEAAAAYMGLENPVGEQIQWGPDETFTVIGVVENLVTQSPYGKTKQMIFYPDFPRAMRASIRLRPEIFIENALAEIDTIYKSYDSLNDFEYQFTDQAYARKFGDEERIGKLAGLFTILAILISCMGLFGLASYVATRRSKEISIRKILGASVISLWKLLSKDFVTLVLIASFISIPLSWYFGSNWLQDFEYRTQLSWWIFAGALMAALAITLITVSYQAIKVANVNPAENLRSE